MVDVFASTTGGEGVAGGPRAVLVRVRGSVRVRVRVRLRVRVRVRGRGRGRGRGRAVLQQGVAEG